MIEFKTELGARFRIVFEHGAIERKSGTMPQTTAKLYTFREGRAPGKQYEFVDSETVTRYYKDKQSKEAGRKAALTHLLRRFGKGFRTLAWQSYLNRPRYVVHANFYGQESATVTDGTTSPASV